MSICIIFLMVALEITVYILIFFAVYLEVLLYHFMENVETLTIHIYIYPLSF